MLMGCVLEGGRYFYGSARFALHGIRYPPIRLDVYVACIKQGGAYTEMQTKRSPITWNSKYIVGCWYIFCGSTLYFIGHGIGEYQAEIQECKEM
jgi:hypothetical protein